MSITDIDTHKITLSTKTMVVLVASVISIVSAHFIETERINNKIDQVNATTNIKVDNNSRLMESQQGLIMANRYKDSIDKVFIELKINELRDEIKNSK